MAGLTLRAIKAKHGDCLMLLADGATVLIDGGPSGVYSRYLRDHLVSLKSNNGEPAEIDLMMVSHIDADHIDGILDLTDELLEARDEDRDPIVRILRAWHNSFADTIAKSESVGSANTVRSEAASIAGILDELVIPNFDPHESKLVLSSVAQGRQLRLDLKALNVDINQRFEGRLAIQNPTNAPWTCGELSMEIIGPTMIEIEKLQKEWAKQLKKILAKEADVASAAQSLDKSVSNLASIVVIAEAGNKRALLTGDARGDMILGWLEKSNKMDRSGKIHFDILKCPHHGSDRNVSKEFFERVTADHYVICGDGGHGNPEPNTFDLLFAARPELNYEIHMTYGPEELKQHKKFKDVGNVGKLEAVLSPIGRSEILRFPTESETHIDIKV